MSEHVQHGGNILALRQANPDKIFYDFSANINPLGAPPWLRRIVSRELENIQHYPDANCTEFIEQVSHRHSLNPWQIIAGNGSSEFLSFMPRVFSWKRWLFHTPSYLEYTRAGRLAGLATMAIPTAESDTFRPDFNLLSDILRPGDALILGRPNNPDGQLVAAADIVALAAAHPHSDFLIDEAFLEFSGADSLAGYADNIITLHSMTKFYAIPGLRLGYAVMTAEKAEALREHLPPWSVNHLAQAVGAKALADQDYQEKSRAACRDLRQIFHDRLAEIPGLKIYPSVANYLLCHLPERQSGTALAEALRRQGILIRRCDTYQGLDDRFIRLAVRPLNEQDIFFKEIEHILPLKSINKKNKSKKHTPAIMLQGTASNAGKSVLTAAFCRIFLQDGFAVAPFKAQNMSLNSFVTKDGGEMGRAQVMQAQAARLDPDVRMNPILLKPSSDTGSQIIVEGQPLSNMTVNQYDEYKQIGWSRVIACYDSLSATQQIMVLEGAGSPGEVNLKANDIVNMRMAAYAEAPVLLVGDIDRGGVYASFVGHLEVMEEWERRLVAGFIVNRFRGQASLLAAAHEYVHAHTGKDVLGVVPFLPRLGLPEEDSVSFKAGLFNRPAPLDEHVTIAVINLPHISNFTDIEPFLAEPDAHIVICDRPEAAKNADAVIVPGTKNTLADMRFLRESGFSDLIGELARRGVETVGVCGGYQMLGENIIDPLGLESLDGETPGLALIAVSTELMRVKNLRRQKGIHIASGLPVSGYEIHHGVTRATGTNEAAQEPVVRFDDGSVCGARHTHLPVWGSYLHGIFDQDEFRRWFIDHLRQKKGLAAVGRVLAPYGLEAAFDRLADTARQAIDMQKIYKLLGV